MEEKEIRSDIVHEILSRPPGWTLRWGNIVILLLISGLILLCAFIKYPDVILGEAVITTQNPPLRLSSYSSGKIVSILKKENDEVRKNNQVIVIENPTEENHINALRVYLKKTDSAFIFQNKPAFIPLPVSSFLVGDLQPEFNALTSSLSNLNALVLDDFYTKKVRNLEKQINQYKFLISLNQKQYILSQKTLENATTKYNAQKQLYQQEAIAKMDFLKEDDIYMQAQKQVQEAEKTQVQNQITLTDYEKQLNEIVFDKDNKIRQLTLSSKQHLSNLQNQLAGWQRNFTIQSPQDGRVSFIKSLSVGEFVKQGEVLLAIVPAQQSYIARISVPSTNTGKIKEGQVVNIKLSNFPYAEFGQLTGTVKTISVIPNEKNNYSVEVILSRGLKTSYNREIEYRPEMGGSAEIVTENLSILDRVFNKFRSLLITNGT